MQLSGRPFGAAQRQLSQWLLRVHDLFPFRAVSKAISSAYRTIDFVNKARRRCLQPPFGLFGNTLVVTSWLIRILWSFQLLRDANLFGLGLNELFLSLEVIF